MEAEGRAKTKSLRDRIAQLEKKLKEVNADLKRMEEEFADPEFYAAKDDVAQVTKRYEATKRRINRLEAQWTESMQLLESES